LDNIRNGVLWFSNPHHHFNDPFDCQAVLLDARITDQEIKDESIRVGIDNPDLAQWHLETSLWAQLLCRIWNDVSVACFSETVDDMLMWSHYTNGHTGFCLEFDTSIAPFNDARPVIYKTAFPKLKLSTKSLKSATNEQLTNSLISRMVLTKHRGWRYEREWRVVRSEGAHTEAFDKRAITGVYMGAKMPWQKDGELRSAVAPSEPTYNRMVRLPQRFGVSPLPFTFASGS
jgi:hypothetical protein